MHEIKQIKKSNDPVNYKPKKYDDIVKIVMDSKAENTKNVENSTIKHQYKPF